MIRVSRGAEPEALRLERRTRLSRAILHRRAGAPIDFSGYDVAKADLVKALYYKCVFCDPSDDPPELSGLPDELQYRIRALGSVAPEPEMLGVLQDVLQTQGPRGGWTDDALAALLGRTKSTIRGYRQGSRDPARQVLPAPPVRRRRSPRASRAARSHRGWPCVRRASALRTLESGRGRSRGGIPDATSAGAPCDAS